MYYESKVAERFSFLVNPAGIVVGYIVALFAIVAGSVAFPFSKIWMTLLFVVVGIFFVVSISVIVMAYVFIIVAVYRGLMALGRRVLFAQPALNWRGRASRGSWTRTWVPSEQRASFGIGGSME